MNIEQRLRKELQQAEEKKDVVKQRIAGFSRVMVSMIKISHMGPKKTTDIMFKDEETGRYYNSVFEAYTDIITQESIRVIQKLTDEKSKPSNQRRKSK
jgi:hypothetical protein